MTDSLSSGLPAPRPPVDLRLDRLTPARMYDHFLGGKENFAVDREAAERVKQAIPNTYEIVWENRLLPPARGPLPGRGRHRSIP